MTSVPTRTGCIAIALAAAGALSGCRPEFFANQFQERSGNISYLFVNNTPFRASFTFGNYDPLDLPAGPVNFMQLRLEGFTSSAAIDLECRRIAAVGTPELVERIIRVMGDSQDNFDADALSATVNFSAAPSTSEAAALPTAGTARGLERRLGVEFTCADRLVFVFQEDPSAPGGFRIDYSVIPDENF